ncbi:MAG: hypothetical protein E7259_06550 [Lachnospiraceae bacterium]|nr:hypothetical protein [Lachnospiraceae bacterium]
MGKKNINPMSIVVSCVLTTFFAIIFTFLWFDVLELSGEDNFAVGMMFWFINVICLLLTIVGLGFVGESFPFPFKVSVIMVTVVYTIVDCLLLAFGLANMGKAIYVFINLIILFIYLVIVCPMLLAGSNKNNG